MRCLRCLVVAFQGRTSQDVRQKSHVLLVALAALLMLAVTEIRFARNLDTWFVKLEVPISEVPISEVPTTKSKPTLHVVQGLHGDSKGFIDEWEVALKSILYNAPLDADLHIHLLTNNAAHHAIQDRIRKAGLEGSTWRNQITVSSYNVTKYQAEWTDFLHLKIRGPLDERVSLGGYYRLLASQVLPHEIGPVLYMDTDIVILTNLNDIFQYMDRKYMYQFSATWPNSGFMILNMETFDEFWNLLDQLPEITHGGDQKLVVMVADKFPNVTGTLPPEWDTHLGHGWRRRPHDLLDKQENVGILHFTGSRRGSYFENGFMQYCDRTPDCSRNKEAKDKFMKSWAMADYYVRLQWSWVKYFGKSSIGMNEKGHVFRLDLYD